MTVYKEKEILEFIVEILNQSISDVGFPPYDYRVYLEMEPREALEELSFRLRRIRDIREGSKRDFHFYFATESAYMKFLVESALAECLNVYFVLKKEKISLPALNDEQGMYGRENIFSKKAAYNMTPFNKWLKVCQGRRAKPIRMVKK